MPCGAPATSVVAVVRVFFQMCKVCVFVQTVFWCQAVQQSDDRYVVACGTRGLLTVVGLVLRRMVFWAPTYVRVILCLFVDSQLSFVAT